jgi:tetratricopeptide (TPR) repeat protein
MLNPPSSARAAGALTALALSACASAPVRVPAVKPAEINMAHYQSVAIGAIFGNGAGPIGDALEGALANSHQFQVVDRSRMDELMKEVQVTPFELLDPKGAQKLSKVLAGGALILGDASDRFRESSNKSAFKDASKASHAVNTSTGEVYVRVTFKVVDVSSGRLIVAKTYEERRDDSTSAVDKKPGPVDRRNIERAAFQAVVARFMKAIVPHTEYMEARFEKDSDIPQLEPGIAHAAKGEWKEAHEAFTAALQDAETGRKLKQRQVATCYWDLGLSYEYSGDYEKADEMIGKAYKLTNDEGMMAELNTVKRLLADSKRQGDLARDGPAGTK